MASTMRALSLGPDDGRGEMEGEVLRSLVDGLIAEDLFGFRSRGRIGSVAGALYLPLSGDERHVQVGLGSGALVFRARPAAALQPYRLSRPPILLLGPDGNGPVPLTPGELLALVVERLADSRPANLAEVLDGLDLAATHGAVLRGAEAAWGRVRHAERPSLLDWEALTALGDRPFHPTGRARVGWDQARYRRYSPAASRPFSLDWVAVRRDHLACGTFDRLEEALSVARPRPGHTAGSLPPGRPPAGSAGRHPAPADALLPAGDRAALESAMAAHGVDGPDFVVLPVHPWQHAHVLPGVFAAEWRSGICRPVAEGLGAFRPTASTRTLVPAAGSGPSPGQPVHVKLPVGISTLGALRLLPPRYLANAARAQALLEAAARRPALAGRVFACDERAWWAFAPGSGDRAGGAGYEDKPGHLGCLLRVWPEGIGTGPGESLVPLGAVGVTVQAGAGAGGAPALPGPGGAAPGLARLIAERGDDPASPEAALAVFDDIARVVSEVALGCFGLGFMPELHGQNAVLAMVGGRARGIVFRDHDTVRLHRPWLADAGLPDPGYDVKPGTPNSLWASGPEELLGWFQTLAVEVSLHAVGRALTAAYGVDEDTVWRRLADVVRAARAGVDLRPEAAGIADRQLFGAAGWPTKLVLGPLLARVGTGGGSMPSGTGRAGNPFLAGEDRAAELAGHAAAERLVNCFLRESEAEPVVVGSTITIPFPRTGRTVVGSLAYRSAVGHHRFRPGFTLRTGETVAPADLARLVAAEIGPAAGSPATGSPATGSPATGPDGFTALVEDSTAKTRLFLERLPVTGTVEPWHDRNPFLAAEQAVRFGHPFHPAPKASGGFGPADLERYAPELGASFPLHWLAVDPQLLDEGRLPTVRSLDPPPALSDAAGARLGGARATWPLLPCHPWQAEYLAATSSVLAELVAAGRVVALGPLGKDVHPTASVRTVWDPASGRQLKLSLSVRITNFVRENSAEHLRRSLDASRVLADLGDLAAATGSAPGTFGVLLELGFRRLVPPAGLPADRIAPLGDGTGVLYREAPPLAASAAPMVVAGLLDPDPVDGVPPLVRAVQQATGGEGDGRLWFERYLEISLRPLLRLLIRHGIALEAHTQNSLVVLDDGWPVSLVVRDLEGASVNGDHPRAGEAAGDLAAAGSPVLYGEAEVWRRFTYYGVVNHLGHLVATLAEHVGPTESELWGAAGAVLADESVRHGSDPAAGPLRQLLDGAVLPAKANLTSVLGGHSEHPAWVGIPNPLRSRSRSRSR